MSLGSFFWFISDHLLARRNFILLPKPVPEAVNELLIIYFQESYVNLKTIRIHTYWVLVLGLVGRLFLGTSKYIGFEIIRAVSVALELYSSVKVQRRFGGTHYVQFHGRSVDQKRNQPEASSKQSLLG